MASCRKPLIPSDPGPDRPVGLAHLGPHHGGDGDHHRHNREHDQCHPPVDPQQEAGNDHQREQVADDGDQARGEQLVQRVDVVRHAGDEDANRRVVEVGKGHPLQVREDRIPQVEHHPLTK